MIRLYRNSSARSSLKGCARPICCLATIPCCCRKAGRHSRSCCRAGLYRAPYFSIDNSTDWQAIFALSRAMSLFASRQTLLLILPENGPNAAINEQLAMLVGLLHDDLLLIVRGNKLTKARRMPHGSPPAQRAVQSVARRRNTRSCRAGWPPVPNSISCSSTTRPVSCCATVTKAICWRWRRRWSVWRCSGRTVS
nr:DNA polymerase III subunit delta [Klebsiella pneumoniae]